MRLDPASVSSLPLPAALLDGNGTVWRTTPEWKGRRAGSLLYRLSEGASLVISSDEGSEALDSLLDSLLEETRLLTATLDREKALRIEVLASALELVAGRPLEQLGGGTTDDVVDMTLAALPARVQGIRYVETKRLEPPVGVRAPAVIALALLQLADNAHRYEGVREIGLRVSDPGPSFFVEWRSDSPGVREFRPRRRSEGDRGWGWVYIQMAADALGALPMRPRETRPGVEGASFLLRGASPGPPLARVSNGCVTDCSQSWNSDPTLPSIGDAIAPDMASVVDESRGRPGYLARGGLFAARTLRDDTALLAVMPQTGIGRAREVLRGLAHESALWEAPGPRGTRAYTLIRLMGVVTGQPWPRVSKTDWEAWFPGLCASLGVAPVPELDTLDYPDPRLAAHILAELKGQLRTEDREVYVEPAGEHRNHPLMVLLSRAGRLPITPTNHDTWE